MFGRLLAAGLSMTIVSQAFINMSVVLGLSPPRAFPFPSSPPGHVARLVPPLRRPRAERLCNTRIDGLDSLILIAAGGMGGHIFPGLAVAEEIAVRARECGEFWGSSALGLERRIVPGPA